MKLFGRELTGIPKALVVLVAVLISSFVLFGLAWEGLSSKSTSALPVFLFIAGEIALLATLLSLLGIVALLVIWAMRSTARALSARGDEPPIDEAPRPVDDSKDTNSDEKR